MSGCLERLRVAESVSFRPARAHIVVARLRKQRHRKGCRLRCARHLSAGHSPLTWGVTAVWHAVAAVVVPVTAAGRPCPGHLRKGRSRKKLIARNGHSVGGEVILAAAQMAGFGGSFR